MQPLISIVIPVYKVEPYILKCLSSVVAQTYQNIEVWLIDDASPDQSMVVVADYLSNHPPAVPVHILTHSMNRGLSEARNTGMAAAKGEYLFFIDSDDWLAQDSIELLVKSARLYNSEVVIGQTMCFLEGQKTEKMVFPLKTTIDYLGSQDEVFEAFMKGAWPVIAPNKLYSNAFLKSHHLKFTAGLLGEDELWAFQWAQVAERVSFVQQVTYYYLLRGNSIIATRSEKNFEDMFFVLNEIHQAYQKTTDRHRHVLLQKYMLNFKEMILIMQWQSLAGNVDYLKKNYARLRQYGLLGWRDILSPDFSFTDKKKSFLLHLPASLGTRFFIWRYER